MVQLERWQKIRKIKRKAFFKKIKKAKSEMYQSIRTGKSEKYPKIRKVTKDQKGYRIWERWPEIRKVTKDRKSDQSSERLPKIRTVPKIGKVRSEGWQKIRTNNNIVLQNTHVFSSYLALNTNYSWNVMLFNGLGYLAWHEEKQSVLVRNYFYQFRFCLCDVNSVKKMNT